jgi:tetratricopeptide (TPR) repeat protein
VRQARAQALIANGEAAKAVDDYEEAAPAYPAERAWCYWLAGDEDSAIATYKRLDRQNAATARDQYDLGRLLYNAARFEEARSAFSAAAESAPGVLAPRLMKLRLWLQDGHPVRIARLAREIEEEFGEHPDVCEARGHAMIFARRSAHFDPEGETHLVPYDHSFVIEQFSLACGLDSSNPRRFYRVAKVLFDLGDYRNSGATAAAGLRVMPESSSLQVVLAQVAEYGPEGAAADQDAAQLYQEAARAEPDELDRDDDPPVFDGDERRPRPVQLRYTTVPLKLAGVAWA